jgi:hypothetical protein
MFNVFETQQKKHISILQNGDPSISKGKNVVPSLLECSGLSHRVIGTAW